MVNALIRRKAEAERAKTIMPLLMMAKVAYLPLVNDNGKKEVQDDMENILKQAIEKL